MRDYIPLLQTALWVALALIGITLFRRSLVERLRLGGSVKVGPVELGEIRDKVVDVQRQVSDLNDKVAKLFLLTMASPMYANLKKLASGRFGEYTMNDGLARELYHLRDIGYIEVESIRAIPREGLDLSDHIAVSHTGLQFVRLRDEVNRS